MRSISFRHLTRDDFTLLHHWLNEREVLTWYTRQVASVNDVAAKYLPRIKGLQPVSVYLSAVDGTDAGLMQAYLLKDFLEYARAGPRVAASRAQVNASPPTPSALRVIRNGTL
jgi:hypothetical protein